MKEPTAAAMCEFEGSPEFAKLLKRPGEINLVHLMLELAADAYPDLDRVGCLMEIDRLGVACSDRVATRNSLGERLHAVSEFLYDIEGFHGNRDDYYEPENSYLNQVLARRRGIPISLGILYMAVAARTGMRMFGLNTPGHFMIAACAAGQMCYVDPFSGGDVLDRRGCEERIAQMVGRSDALCDEHFRPASPLDIVARVLRNLKAAFAMRNDWSSVLEVQRRLAALLPQIPQERRDLGLVYLRLGQPTKALHVLEPYLAVCGSDQAEALRPSLKVARRMVAELN
ncbi:MAG TPA: transglutaminase-like domain-containing protein [Pirellulales bacterium]|nr:transglutaminase-like domain-containing protein [Pirellulales bacterium]